MSEEMLKILNDLSKKETTELALQIMELTADNLSKDKEIERLNNELELQNIEMGREIERLNNIINELSEKNRNLIEDNMRLRKELNLHSGKLYISDIEVKNVF